MEGERVNVEGLTLQALVADRKGDRSYEQLAVRSGGVLSRARLQQIATRETKAFPDAATLRGLGTALDVPVHQVVLAAARSLGLDVRESEQSDALLVPRGKTLSWAAQEALLTIARELERAEVSHDEVERERDQVSSEVGERRAAPAAGGGRVADPAQRDGVTAPPASADEREPFPWEQGDFDLAAKRGRNRGREVREQQDREAEDGGA